MKAGVIVFPGSNCDIDAYKVLERLNVEVKYIWHDEKIDDEDLILLPGGFSYGDYLRCGAIARFARALENINEHIEKGKLVLGICNGFQILTELKALPGALLRNKNLNFICSDCNLIVENNATPFTNLFNKGDVVNFPIAHGEGNYYIDDDGLKELIKNNQIVFRYQNNPNGSVYDIAGIVNKKGNVLGMMPHPERAQDKLLGCEDGLKLFNSIIAYFKEA
ncbi:phosphoribosylformylglycinamidine synthase subunit PurQ [Thermobrachium celere]|uniref:Phosphoribosylformylglycinamidine synthase subunit PurQ n=1 Tax=Thermobrachium celere DSM 8682 TaxID=941824 RepID=R7RTX6_9CLOT|nr:phosphoribosylformylglycinamidine synthase subunit PurQ [Thermobrachium celere]CDF59484.1 Phosphoribosylformylglycinamidine synthase, glutamine amidotransferase subunit [Thermobrachium celere DSM 8682]